MSGENWSAGGFCHVCGERMCPGESHACSARVSVSRIPVLDFAERTVTYVTPEEFNAMQRGSSSGGGNR